MAAALLTAGFVAYTFDVRDRFFVDHGYRFAFDATRPLEEVRGKEYRNDSVTIDGKRFIDCSFDNVTVVYNGTAKSEFVDTVPRGEIVLKSDNPSIQTMIHLMRANKMISKDVPVFDPDARSR